MGNRVAQTRSQGKHGQPWLVSEVRCRGGVVVLDVGPVIRWSGFVG